MAKTQHVVVYENGAFRLEQTPDFEQWLLEAGLTQKMTSYLGAHVVPSGYLMLADKQGRYKHEAREPGFEKPSALLLAPVGNGFLPLYGRAAFIRVGPKGGRKSAEPDDVKAVQDFIVWAKTSGQIPPAHTVPGIEEFERAKPRHGHDGAMYHFRGDREKLAAFCNWSLMRFYDDVAAASVGQLMPGCPLSIEAIFKTPQACEEYMALVETHTNDDGELIGAWADLRLGSPLMA